MMSEVNDFLIMAVSSIFNVQVFWQMPTAFAGWRLDMIELLLILKENRLPVARRV